ncbi:MAG: enoyl-CoA hydratase/isomerase family protein [Firmicutes bacterium]|nr:enoyl-CoA hydratase/isomerase family protein [Bacillota bacterium]
MTEQYILTEKQDGIGIITLNRPEQRNALCSQLNIQLEAALRAFGADPEVRVIVLTGGTRFFAAGGDIEEMAPLNSTIVTMSVTATDAYSWIERVPKPVIASVAGFALGGGMEMLLCCDLVIAADNAVMGLPEIRLGIIPGAGGTQRLSRIVGRNVAKQLIFTGDTIDAETARQLGIVNKVVPVDSLVEETMKLAKRIAGMGGVALAMAKSAVNHGLNVDLPSGLIIENRNIALLFATEDQKEGMNAFLEKRKAQFKGK